MEAHLYNEWHHKMIHPIHCKTNNTFYNKFSHVSRLFLSPEQSPAPVQFANLNRQSSGTVTVTCSYLWTSSGPDTTRWYKIEPDLNYIQAESCCWAAKEKLVVQDTVRVHISKRLWINDKNKKKCTVSADCGGRNTSSFSGLGSLDFPTVQIQLHGRAHSPKSCLLYSQLAQHGYLH